MKTLDLHGQISSEAKVNLEIFIKESYLQREYQVLIIHGNGEMIIKKEVNEVLDNTNLILSYELAPPQIGGSGATLVKINNKRGLE